MGRVAWYGLESLAYVLIPTIAALDTYRSVEGDLSNRSEPRVCTDLRKS